MADGTSLDWAWRWLGPSADQGRRAAAVPSQDSGLRKWWLARKASPLQLVLNTVYNSTLSPGPIISMEGFEQMREIKA